MSTEAQRGGGEASNTDTNDKFRSRGASKGKLGRKKSAYATLRVQAKEGVADRIKQYSGAGGAEGEGGEGGGGGAKDGSGGFVYSTRSQPHSTVVDRVETHESRSGTTAAAENVATFRMNVGSRDQSWGEGSLESLTSDDTDAGTVQVVELRYQQGGSKGSRSGRDGGGGGGGGGGSLVGASSDSGDYDALDGLSMDSHDDSWGGGTDSTTTATDTDGGGEGGGYAHMTSARGVRVAGGGKKTHTTRHRRKQHQQHEKTASLYAPAVEADMDALVMSSDSGGDEGIEGLSMDSLDDSWTDGSSSPSSNRSDGGAGGAPAVVLKGLAEVADEEREEEVEEAENEHVDLLHAHLPVEEEKETNALLTTVTVSKNATQFTDSHNIDTLSMDSHDEVWSGAPGEEETLGMPSPGGSSRGMSDNDEDDGAALAGTSDDGERSGAVGSDDGHDGATSALTSTAQMDVIKLVELASHVSGLQAQAQATAELASSSEDGKDAPDHLSMDSHDESWGAGSENGSAADIVALIAPETKDEVVALTDSGGDDDAVDALRMDSFDGSWTGGSNKSEGVAAELFAPEALVSAVPASTRASDSGDDSVDGLSMDSHDESWTGDSRQGGQGSELGEEANIVVDMLAGEAVTLVVAEAASESGDDGEIDGLSMDSHEESWTGTSVKTATDDEFVDLLAPPPEDGPVVLLSDSGGDEAIDTLSMDSHDASWTGGSDTADDPIPGVKALPPHSPLYAVLEVSHGEHTVGTPDAAYAVAEDVDCDSELNVLVKRNTAPGAPTIDKPRLTHEIKPTALASSHGEHVAGVPEAAYSVAEDVDCDSELTVLTMSKAIMSLRVEPSTTVVNQYPVTDWNITFNTASAIERQGYFQIEFHDSWDLSSLVPADVSVSVSVSDAIISIVDGSKYILCMVWAVGGWDGSASLVRVVIAQNKLAAGSAKFWVRTRDSFEKDLDVDDGAFDVLELPAVKPALPHVHGATAMASAHNEHVPGVPDAEYKGAEDIDCDSELTVHTMCKATMSLCVEPSRTVVNQYPVTDWTITFNTSSAIERQGYFQIEYQDSWDLSTLVPADVSVSVSVSDAIISNVDGSKYIRCMVLAAGGWDGSASLVRVVIAQNKLAAGSVAGSAKFWVRTRDSFETDLDVDDGAFDVLELPAVKPALPHEHGPDGDVLKGVEDDEPYIGSLDIFGFEVLEANNRFGQICTNFANEKLQQLYTYTHFVFDIERKIYREEGINLASVSFEDNKAIINMIAKPSTGIFHLLADCCMFADPSSTGMDQKFLGKITQVHKRTKEFGKPDFKKRDSFTVKHSAADVCYSVGGFVLKNKDRLETAVEKSVQDAMCSTDDAPPPPSVFTLFILEGVSMRNFPFRCKSSDTLERLFDRSFDNQQRFVYAGKIITQDDYDATPVSDLGIHTGSTLHGLGPRGLGGMWDEDWCPSPGCDKPAGHSRRHDENAKEAKRTMQRQRAEEKGDDGDGDAPVDEYRLLPHERWEEEMVERLKQSSSYPSDWYKAYISKHRIPNNTATPSAAKSIAAIRQWHEAQQEGDPTSWSGDADHHGGVFALMAAETDAREATGSTATQCLAVVRSERENLLEMFRTVKEASVQRSERERIGDVAQDIEQHLKFKAVEVQPSQELWVPPSGASKSTGKSPGGGWHRSRLWTGEAEFADPEMDAKKAAFRSVAIDVLDLGTGEGRSMAVSVLECFLTPRAIEENIRLWVVNPTRIGTYGFASIEAIIINGCKWESKEMDDLQIPLCSLLVRRLLEAGVMKRGEDGKICPGGHKLDKIAARVGIGISVEAIVSLLYDHALVEGYLPLDRFILWACVRVF
jgi:hypothetical protein